MTPEQLRVIMPQAKKRVDTFFGPLVKTMAEFEIDTKPRKASFLAQLAHESGQLLYVQELASGKAYEGRADLGNTSPGDGVRYKGRGLIQLTGKANYLRCLMALGIDCIEHPELLETPENAARVSGWFWSSNKLNLLADKGDQRAICRRVNGGYNGLQERLDFFAVAWKTL